MVRLRPRARLHRGGYRADGDAVVSGVQLSLVTDLDIERLKRSDKLTPEEILKYALHDAENRTANEPGEPIVKVMVLAVVEVASKRHKLVTYVSGFASPAEQMGYFEAFRDKEMRRWGEG